MSAVLEIVDLRTTFMTGTTPAIAVDGVSFALADGETLGIVGESGSGKTVMALSILRLLNEPPASVDPASRIIFEGRNLLALSERELRPVRGGGIAMIFQDPGTSLNPVLTVGVQVAETVRAHKNVSRADARARAIELLAQVGIPAPADRYSSYPHEMSGGMLQRVMTAIALAGEPRVLIADEPTTALDVTIQAQILDLLLDLKERLGMAVILITHDLGVAAYTSDRIGVMYGGQIVELAPARDILDNPKHPYTRGLLAATPSLEHTTGELVSIPGNVPPATNWPSGCRFHPRCNTAISRCGLEAPPPFDTGSGHLSRCWLSGEEVQ